jgi:hypothetical protein
VSFGIVAESFKPPKPRLGDVPQNSSGAAEMGDFNVISLSRRSVIAWLASAAAGLPSSGKAHAEVASQATSPLPSFTGPGVNPWNGINPFVTYPQKLPLLCITDRGIQLETPRPYFLTPFTRLHHEYRRRAA